MSGPRRSLPHGEVSRFAPEQSLPAYAYVPGHFPHPTRDPQGHSYGIEPRVEIPDPNRWQSCQAYLYGVDLFNHGYYWEAHEAWEGLWNACGRSGPAGCFFKGLIRLAAAGVKTRQASLRGIQIHARRAAELFEQTATELGAKGAVFMGLCLEELIRRAEEIAGQTQPPRPSSEHAVDIVFDFILLPVASAADRASEQAPD